VLDEATRGTPGCQPSRTEHPAARRQTGLSAPSRRWVGRPAAVGPCRRRVQARPRWGGRVLLAPHTFEVARSRRREPQLARGVDHLPVLLASGRRDLRCTYPHLDLDVLTRPGVLDGDALGRLARLLARDGVVALQEPMGPFHRAGVLDLPDLVERAAR